jgi:hypothetical protein
MERRCTMDINEFIPKAKELVSNWANDHVDISDNISNLGPEDVYVVWFCKTLQNAKALLSTPLPDGMYYEVTCNGDKSEIYFDAYKKFHNMRVEV